VRNWDTVSALAHDLKGSAATIGAHRLAELAGAVDAIVSAGRNTGLAGDALGREIAAIARALGELTQLLQPVVR
jgi:HPt (histidine-containing phosphotransfer) domain-containing protein